MAVSTQRVEISPEVSKFVTTPRKMLINGEWLDSASGKTFPVYNPATGEVLAHVAEGDKAYIEQAVQAARKAFESGPWHKLSPSQRGQLIWRLGDLIQQNSEEFAQLESLDKNGNHLRSHAPPIFLSPSTYSITWQVGPPKIEGNTIPFTSPGKNFAYTLREPVGVVGQIIPWNFPLLMAAWKLGPALTAGCTVVLKPARANATQRATAWRTHYRSWFPSRCRQYRPWLWRDGRSRTCCPPRCR